LSDRATWFLGFIAGGVITFTVIGHTLPPLSLLFQNYGSTGAWVTGFRWLDTFLRAIEPVFWAVWFYGRELVLRNLAFGTQIGWWVYTIFAGGVSQDNDIFLFLVGWLSWVVAFHVMVAFSRGRRPTWALAPLGLVVTVAVAGGRGGNGWLYAVLGLGTILWAQGAFLQWERCWIRDRTDYSPEIRLDVAMAGFMVALVAVAIAAGLAWGLPWAGTVLRRPLAGPTQHVANTLDRLFGGVRRPPTTGGGSGETDFAALPLSRVLAGPPELRDDVVLKVRVPAAPEAGVPRTYWRGLTYDQYTGRGWANSDSEIGRRPPRPIQVAYLGPEVTQHVELLIEADPVRYAAAQPVQVDVDATWVVRDSDDLVAWYADAAKYTVVSRPTMASVEALRGATSDYPAWVIERYLRLPADLPGRVRQQAEAIVGDAATAYDKAAALEAAMRAITYDLEVEQPPPDRDIVDYFLFDMEAGYCDYFATTMTVLARAVGVPARLATGYAMGTYDAGQGAYLVTGLDAHAWVEVYFPGIGWVPFEPTPARAVMERMPAPPLVSSRSERLFDIRIGRVRLGQPVAVLLGLAVAGGLGLWGIQRRRFAKLSPEDRVRTLYDAVWRAAGWFGWDGNASQTAWEQVGALQCTLAGRSLQVAVGNRQLTWRGADAIEDLNRLGALFVKAQYSRHGVSPEEARAARDAWHRVRGRLILLWHRNKELITA
jgi:transglutaminase-like putative cysteine protease